MACDIPKIIKKRDIAFVIGNGGLGDMITHIGLVNYLSTQYKNVLVACMIVYYEQAKHFYCNKNIKLYPINKNDNTNMYEFCNLMLRHTNIYDIYALGNYGAVEINNKLYLKTMHNGTVKKIIHDYPISYYEDVNMPIDIMTKYFNVTYPQEIIDLYDILLKNYPIYTIIHQKGSNIPSLDIVKHQRLNIDNTLVIDVNKNLYDKKHKYYDIAQKFVNLPSVIYYTKLVENASELYLVDSCIHAIALVVDVSKAKQKICYQRESRFTYAFGKFKYYHLIFQNGVLQNNT